MLSECLKPSIHRMGGKAFMCQWLCQYVPKHITYVEPFAGAAHLLFAKTPSKVEVINDLDGYLIDFFRTIKDREKRLKLVETLQYMPYSRSLWNEIRSKWKAGDIPQDEIERVSWWYYLNRTCFGGDQQSGGFAVPSTTGRNPVQSFRNAVTGLNAVAERLRHVCIESLDFQECIRRYDSIQTLFYADAPYLDAGHYYGKDFNHKDHHVLAKLLHEVKGKAMVSHYANRLYDELYKGWHRYESSSFKGSHKSEGEEKPKTVECLWTNFEAKKTQKVLFQGMNL